MSNYILAALAAIFISIAPFAANASDPGATCFVKDAQFCTLAGDSSYNVGGDGGH